MRPRKTDRHLPKSVYRRRGAYYYVRAGRWLPLGRDLSNALAEYGRLHSETPVGALDGEIDAALTAISGKVSPATRVAYGVAVAWIKRLFRKFTSLNQIQGKDVAAAKRLLSDKPIMANRVLAVFRQMCAYWLEQQMIDDNPAVGVKSYPHGKRSRLISEHEFRRIYDKATPQLQVVLELWRLTGQRVMDVVRIRRADLKTEGIYFRQQKTGSELIVQWNVELAAVVERAKAMHGNVKALTLIHNSRGRVPGYAAINRQWLAASRAAGVQDVQARDLRAMALTALKRQKGKAAAQGLGGHKREATTDTYLRDREVPIVEGPSFVVSIGQSKKGFGQT